MRQSRLVVAFLLALPGPWAACGSSGGGVGATAGSGPGGNAGTAAAGTSGGAGSGGVAGTQASGAAGTETCAAADGGAAGTDSGGTGGAATGGDGGVAGRGGTGGGAIITGVLIDCPASPPSGCCSVENLSCAYPTQSCVCGNGAWKCYACPATRPATPSEGVETLTDLRLWMTCQYGNVTCSYPTTSDPFDVYRADQWGCGVCPGTRPDDGTACGNTAFECRYGADTCQCGGTAGWKCASPSCQTRSSSSTGQGACVSPGHFTCSYPALDQVCACGTIRDSRRCTCPATRPTGPCMAYGGHDGMLTNCMYGDTKCSCDGSSWQCIDPICPTAMPASGSSCTMQLSCSYGATFCACDGATWSCS